MDSDRLALGHAKAVGSLELSKSDILASLRRILVCPMVAGAMDDNGPVFVPYSGDVMPQEGPHTVAPSAAMQPK